MLRARVLLGALRADLDWRRAALGVIVGLAACAGPASESDAGRSDAGRSDAARSDADIVAVDGGRTDGACVAACEACSLAYCAGHCGAHRACIEASSSCDDIIGCIMGPAPDGGPSPQRSVWLQPADLVTDVDVADLGAYATGELVPSADESLAAALVLTDAVGAMIPTTTEVQSVEVRGDARIRVRPESALAEGWYVLRVQAWPEGYAPAVRALPGEGRAIRVRIGSA
ncbi:MAG: hypothetical protein M3Y87_36125, partial [Myxococcota bacterium]|nr:hypothetical protein [Myxococcota bacterium]